ncbi:type IV conjugative transfer system coupling protein TraD [Burkholderia multivorans]|uniref:Type IV conjugative transfer system coupling protein TraD n=1 Tax=Burkholderia multivorans TaxID=87883 RepID=A0AAP2HPJ8_9BURK|nr:type IV conjugative transfer system coupling protein TraD [Burkholderia multivorans]MBU9360218.1 type IV conjugative transfer system coupling protein TraD [Burkholderia multivorans]MBU9368862.1 type IV conjugative transfer system coupling protein TraD [Burkholderia multivorans]HDR9017873.1 type IV conjugative transfer system coupling protein TraD [Burkholderia vietnamiensis]
MAYPVENRFRRPVELLSSVAALAATGVLWSDPALFLVTPATGGVTTLALLAVAFVRGRQAWQLIRFQRNLRRLPQYVIPAAAIPCSDREVFLGRGFRWSGIHTQRLYQARLPENRRLLARNDLYDHARDYERLRPDGRLARITRRQAWWNPVAPLPPVGGDPALHGVEPEERDIWFDLAERVGHMAVLGTTRVGKTRLCEVLVAQDIRRGDIVIVFDPKGDVDLLLRMYAEAKRCGRESEFTFFHLGYPDKSARYSPIGTYSRITEVATRIAGNLPKEGQSAAFRDFVWRFVNVMARAMSALGIRPTYEMIYQNAVNIDGLALRYFRFWLDRDHPGWEDGLEPLEKEEAKQAMRLQRNQEVLQVANLIRQQGWTDPIANGLLSVISNERSYFDKLISSLYPLLEKLTTGRTSELLSPDYGDPDDPRPVFDWNRVMDRGGIVYVGLDALSDFEVAGVVGNAMFADLTSTAGRIYKYGHGYGQSTGGGKRRVSIHADEFNELVGDEFVPMVNKAGGAGYQVTAYTQTSADVEAKIGSRAKAEQIFGNFNTLVMLRVKYVTTATILTDQLPMVDVKTLTLASSATDAVRRGEGVHFTAQTHDQISVRPVPMLQPSDLTQLPKGQAFALIEGGQLVKVRLPLLDALDPVMLPGLDDVVADMRSRYASYVQAVSAFDDAGGVSPDAIGGAVGSFMPGGASDSASTAALWTVEGKGAGF